MYAPIDGLRMLAVETSLLIAFSVLAFLFLHFVRPWISRPRWLDAILARNSLAVLLVIVVALAGRALLLPWVGIPQPRINDEYSYLLMGDTFAHFRLANPTPPAWPHFETFHVTLTPTYHSKYPVAQGLALAVGEIVFHQPWIGVYLSTALLCGAICWALQAFVPPGWALLAALLATVRIALFSYWMNSYWGGSMPALGGALALGAMVRLFDSAQPERNRALLASVFALGLLLLATSRPYEGLAFSLPLLAYFAYQLTQGVLRREVSLRSTVLPMVAIGLVGLLLIGHYNRRTTGNPLLMPYVLNERTYSSLPLFLGQSARPNLPARDPVFAKYYAVEAEEHELKQTKSPSELMWWEIWRWGMNWFFYVGPALSFPVLLGLLLCIKERRLWIVLAVALTTGVAVALCVFTQFHYFAPATIAVYVFFAAGLRYLWEQRSEGARAFVAAVCLTVVVVSLARQTAIAAVNVSFRLPDVRKLVAQQLEHRPGKHLVIVRYDMQQHYPGDELVHNGADFGSEKILWARSKGAGNDADLCGAYPNRIFWSVTTDDVNYSLNRLDICEREKVGDSGVPN
jgi:hypothetical protein